MFGANGTQNSFEWRRTAPAWMVRAAYARCMRSARHANYYNSALGWGGLGKTMERKRRLHNDSPVSILSLQ